MSNSLRRSPLDEGYSEHPLTVVNQPKFEGLPSWLAELSTEDRAGMEQSHHHSDQLISTFSWDARYSLSLTTNPFQIAS